jgi:hypothetical protein
MRRAKQQPIEALGNVKVGVRAQLQARTGMLSGGVEAGDIDVGELAGAVRERRAESGVRGGGASGA